VPIPVPVNQKSLTIGSVSAQIRTRSRTPRSTRQARPPSRVSFASMTACARALVNNAIATRGPRHEED